MKLFLSKILIILFFTLSQLHSSAQQIFKPGYLVTNEGDTIKGEIDYKVIRPKYNEVAFKNFDKGETKIYLADQLKEYRLVDGQYFLSTKAKVKKVESQIFMEVLYKGNISIYLLTDNFKKYFYVDKEGLGVKEMPYHEENRIVPRINESDAKYVYKSTTHQQILKYYTSDSPKLKNNIERIVEPNEVNLVMFAKLYQGNSENKTHDTFQTDIPFLKIDPELGIGFINAFNPFYLIHNNVTGGIFLNIYSPRLTNKFYFKTGIVYVNAGEDNAPTSKFKIPLQFEYIYPKV